MWNTCLVVIDIIYKFASVGTLIFLSWQIREAKQTNKLSNKQFEDKKKEDNIRHQKDEREKAIQMAELYANELISNITYLKNVYSKCGVTQYFKNLQYTDFKDFDVYELEAFIKSKIDIKEMEKLTSDIDLMILVDSAHFLNKDVKEVTAETINILNLKKFIDRYENEAAASLDIIAQNVQADDLVGEEELFKDAKMEYATYSISYNKEFRQVLCDTLNKLEYFCMYFNAGVADEETIYQSLHQSFLEMVRVIYFRIASRNKSGKDKYFTNIIKLYNKWADRYFECLQKEIESTRNNTHEQERIKK